MQEPTVNYKPYAQCTDEELATVSAPGTIFTLGSTPGSSADVCKMIAARYLADRAISTPGALR